MRWRLLSITAVCCFILAELVFRIGVGLGDPPRVVLDDTVEYQLIPNTRYRRFGNRVEINSHGMRAPDHDAIALEQERRVLLIGDSVVYGNHSLDQDETIALQLKDDLENDPRLAGCRLVTMPAAASSWGPVNQAAFLAKTGTLDADLALFIVSAHDLYDTPGKKGALIPYRTRRSFGALDDAAQIAAARFQKRFFENPQAEAPAHVRRAQTLAAMDGVLGLLRSESIPLILIYHPTVPEHGTKLRTAHDQFRDWARSENVPFMVLDDANLSTPDMYRDHIHPAPSGADAIAGYLSEIASQQLAPCSKT